MVRKLRLRIDGGVLLGELPLGPAQGMPSRHPGAQVKPAAHLGGDLRDGAPVAAHPLAQCVPLCFRGVLRFPGHPRPPPPGCLPSRPRLRTVAQPGWQSDHSAARLVGSLSRRSARLRRPARQRSAGENSHSDPTMARSDPGLSRKCIRFGMRHCPAVPRNTKGRHASGTNASAARCDQQAGLIWPAAVPLRVRRVRHRSCPRPDEQPRRRTRRIQRAPERLTACLLVRLSDRAQSCPGDSLRCLNRNPQTPLSRLPHRAEQLGPHRNP
jgi:hypothetical protein